MVVIELAALLKGHVVVGFVIVVVVDDGHITAEALYQFSCDGGLTAAGASGDADDHDIAHILHTPRFYLVFYYNILIRPFQFDFCFFS